MGKADIVDLMPIVRIHNDRRPLLDEGSETGGVRLIGD
jgi:hypothetical protein